MFNFFNLFYRSKSIFGTARLLSGFEKWRLLSKRNKGLVVDGNLRLSEENSFKNLVLVAPTGGGKTTGFIIPNVLNLNSSAVITDPSGEIFNLTAGYLASKGFNVNLIDFSNPKQSLSYNPLSRANSVSDIKKVSEILLSSAYPDSRGESAFWNDLAKSIITILSRCLLYEDSQYRNLFNLRFLLNTFGSDGS